MPYSDFIIENIISFIPSVLLYAELHFRFKWSRSRYYLREPEILADLPYRVEPDTSVPILLLIKDSHQFPITLHEVEVRIYKSNELVKTNNFKYNTSLASPFWEDTVFIETKNILWRISIHRESASTVKRHHHQKKEFKGKVYCPDTINELFYVRREGMSLWMSTK